MRGKWTRAGRVVEKIEAEEVEHGGARRRVEISRGEKREVDSDGRRPRMSWFNTVIAERRTRKMKGRASRRGVM